MWKFWNVISCDGSKITYDDKLLWMTRIRFLRLNSGWHYSSRPTQLLNRPTQLLNLTVNAWQSSSALTSIIRATNIILHLMIKMIKMIDVMTVMTAISSLDDRQWFVYLFDLIWASGKYSCTLIPACFLLACPTWGLAEKCPERTTLSPHSSGPKSCWSHASATSLPPWVGLEPAKDAVEQWRCLSQLSQPRRLVQPINIR